MGAPVESTEPMSENALREAFSIFDVDDDGLITAKELKSIMEQMGNPLTDAEVKDIIAEAGSRKTNSITFAQFAKLMHIGARVRADTEAGTNVSDKDSFTHAHDINIQKERSNRIE